MEADLEHKLEYEMWHQWGSGAHRCVPYFILVSILMRRNA